MGVSLGTLEPGDWDRGCSPGSALGGQKCSRIQESHHEQGQAVLRKGEGRQPYPGQRTTLQHSVSHLPHSQNLIRARQQEVSDPGGALATQGTARHEGGADSLLTAALPLNPTQHEPQG